MLIINFTKFLDALIDYAKRHPSIVRRGGGRKKFKKSNVKLVFDNLEAYHGEAYEQSRRHLAAHIGRK